MSSECVGDKGVCPLSFEPIGVSMQVGQEVGGTVQRSAALADLGVLSTQSEGRLPARESRSTKWSGSTEDRRAHRIVHQRRVPNP